MKKHNLKLLYVEDDKQTRENYQSFFEMIFDTVFCASDGVQGLKIFTKEKPHIVLTDINLENTDGLTLAKNIRKVDPKVPIIIFSAFANQKNLLESIDLGITKFLVKPVKIKQLNETLNNIIANIEKKREDFLLFDCNIKWDIKNQLLYKDDALIKLTKLEQSFLTLLSSSPKNTFCSDDILNYLWAEEFEKDYDTKALRALIYRLKVKLDCQIIESVYNVGYRLILK